MRRGARESQVINNFFTFGTIVIISIVIVLYSKYIANPQEEQEGNNSLKKELITLVCSEQTYSYSKIFNSKLLSESLKPLEKGYYKLDGGYIKSLYSKSYLEEFISLLEMNSFYENSIGILPLENPSKYITIKYEIIENDKKDPNKKDKDCKLHSGSIQTSFRINGKEMFRVFTDFKYLDKIEFQEIIDCTIRTYKANAK